MKKLLILILCGLCSKFLAAQVLVCPYSQAQITSNLTGASYQWKEVTDTGNVDILPDEASLFSGMNTNKLIINSVYPYFTGRRFACLVDGMYSDTFAIKVVNEWTGATDSLWDNPTNWSCGVVPDYATDVIIQNTTTNPVFVNTDAQCRSITLSPAAKFKVGTGVNVNISIQPPLEALSADDLAILDSIPSVYLPLDSTYLEDGRSVTDFFANQGGNKLKSMGQLGISGERFSTIKDTVIARMIEKGNYLMNDANFTAIKVQQPNGLAYIPGGKDHTKLKAPTWGDCKNMIEKYGLDCSGFIYQMHINAGLPLPQYVQKNRDTGKPISQVKQPEFYGVFNLVNPEEWNYSFKESDKFKSLRMIKYSKDILAFEKDNFRTGDIITWGTDHIGMFVDGNTKQLYQSNGKFDSPKCSDGYNWDKYHGPNSKIINYLPVPDKDLGKFWGEFKNGRYCTLRMACLFDQSNTPEFTTNSFKTIAIGKDGAVWAGTNGGGLYKFSKGKWTKWNAYSTVNFQDMKVDKDGGVWIAQSGYNGAQAITGGVLYFPDSTFGGFTFYSTSRGLPSRYVASIFVDTTHYNGAISLPVVWTANFGQLTAGVSAPGGIGRGIDLITPEFNIIREGVDVSLNTGGVFYIGGDAKEIWTFARNNFGLSQILIHNAQTNKLIDTLSTRRGLTGLVPDQFIAKAIYFDAKGNKWVTVNGSGIIVKDKDGHWNKLNDAGLLTANPFFNVNAITGDDDGKVFIGTASGLVIYKSNGLNLTDPNSYYHFTTKDGLPSNNVQAITFNTKVDKSGKKFQTLLIATDKGIIFLDPPY